MSMDKEPQMNASVEFEGKVSQAYRLPHAAAHHTIQYSFYQKGTNPKYAIEVPAGGVPLAVRQQLLLKLQ
jgi:hypothetical protein